MTTSIPALLGAMLAFGLIAAMFFAAAATLDGLARRSASAAGMAFVVLAVSLLLAAGDVP